MLALALLSLASGCNSGLNQPGFPEPTPDTTAPRLQVSGIGLGQEISANTPVTFLATDEHGKVMRILVTIDGGVVLDENFSSKVATTGFTLAWLPEFSGPHTILLSAVDDSGNADSLAVGYSIAPAPVL